MRGNRTVKVDANQGAIVQALRTMGAAVKSIAIVGAGCPDLLVVFRGVTMLLEVKQKGARLTMAEEEFMGTWPGIAFVVTSGGEACLKVAEAARPCACRGGGE